MAAKDRITPSIHLENFDDPRHSNHTNFILTSPRSLRACHRFNIKPVQLLPRSIADFEATYGKNERAFEVFETNRKNILQLVRAERKKYMEDDSLVKPNAVQKDLQKKSLDRGFGCSGAKNSVQFTCTANRLNTEPGNHDQDNVEEVAHRFKRVSVGANGSIESSLKENHLRFPSEEAEGSDSSVDSLQEILAGHRKKESEWWPKVNVRTDGHGCRTSNESMESLSNSQSLESTHCDGAGAARFFSTSRSPVRPLAHTVCTTPRRAEIESLRSHLQHLSSSFLLHQRDVDTTLEQQVHQSQERRKHGRDIAQLRRECECLEGSIKRKDAARRQKIATLKTKLRANGGSDAGGVMDTCLARERLWLERRLGDTERLYGHPIACFFSTYYFDVRHSPFAALKIIVPAIAMCRVLLSHSPYLHSGGQRDRVVFIVC
eukprot:m.337249 g.337249  ORF g.337249 m.337249 type:complete len:433 (+) comp20548_c0_seq4:202-1500(+)